MPAFEALRVKRQAIPLLSRSRGIGPMTPAIMAKCAAVIFQRFYDLHSLWGASPGGRVTRACEVFTVLRHGGRCEVLQDSAGSLSF